MAKPLVGEVVVVPFPNTDLSPGKRRPALVVADLPGDDLVLCQITSQPPKYGGVILSAADFSRGQLSVQSYIRPERLFTVEQRVVLYAAASIRPEKLAEVKKTLRELFA